MVSAPRRRPFVALAALLLTLPQAAASQVVKSVHVQVDNDAFLFWVPIPERPDFEYTHGTHVRIEAWTARLWGRHLAPGQAACSGSERPDEACLSTTWEFGQQIYTPRINSEAALDGQRPHAGWLYGAITANTLREADRHALRLELGVTGPPSLASTLQSAVHRIGGFWKPKGWDHQLAFEPGVLLRYDYARRLHAPVESGEPLWDLTPEVGAAAGNVLTGAHGGATVRLGHNLPHPWRSPETAASPFSAYVSAGGRGRWVLRNLFLDGNTTRESLQVEKLPWVAEQHLGATFRWHDLELEYRVVSRSREYRTEPGGHRYSTIAVTYRQ